MLGLAQSLKHAKEKKKTWQILSVGLLTQ